MKKIFKNPFFTFILGAIICGSVGVIAKGLTAREIEFESSNSWTANTVEQALDDLYAARVPYNYSTEEKVVGKWIDNKTLYQKTVPCTANFTVGYHIFSTTVPDIDTVYEIRGVMVSRGTNANDYSTGLVEAHGASQMVNTYFQRSTNEIRIYNTVDYGNGTAYVTIVYTKKETNQ